MKEKQDEKEIPRRMYSQNEKQRNKKKEEEEEEIENNNIEGKY